MPFGPVAEAALARSTTCLTSDHLGELVSNWEVGSGGRSTCPGDPRGIFFELTLSWSLMCSTSSCSVVCSFPDFLSSSKPRAYLKGSRKKLALGFSLWQYVNTLSHNKRHTHDFIFSYGISLRNLDLLEFLLLFTRLESIYHALLLQPANRSSSQPAIAYLTHILQDLASHSFTCFYLLLLAIVVLKRLYELGQRHIVALSATVEADDPDTNTRLIKFVKTFQFNYVIFYVVLH